MAQVPLTNPERQHLVRLISTRAGAHTATERQNLLDAADLSQFAGRVNLGADTESFSQQLVRELQNYGTLESTGQPALVSLLRWLRDTVRGQEEERDFVDSLLAPYPEPGESPSVLPAAASPSADLTGRGSSGGPGGGSRLGSATTSVGPIRILFMAANPVTTNRLRLDEESRTVHERLRREAELRDGFDFEQQHAVRWSDLSYHLLAYRPHIVHFAGHGEVGGELAFESDRGGAYAMAVEDVGELFEIVQSNARSEARIRGVVLNACWSEAQARAIVPHVDFVIGMTRPIPDDAAIRFAAGFYRGLGFGLDVEAAFKLGRNEMSAGAGGGGARVGGARVGEVEGTAAGGDRDIGSQPADGAIHAGNLLRDIPRILAGPGVDLNALVLVGTVRRTEGLAVPPSDR